MCIYWQMLALVNIAICNVGFCVAVQQRKAMREASNRRTVTDTDSCAFSYNNKRQRGDDRGIAINMCKSLRKVTFSLGRPEFYPDATPNEKAEMENLSKERNGCFHRWVDDVDISKDIPYIKTMALVEDLEDGSIYMVEYYNLKFVEE